MTMFSEDDEEQHKSRSEVRREHGWNRRFSTELLQLEVENSQHPRVRRTYLLYSSLYVIFARKIFGRVYRTS